VSVPSSCWTGFVEISGEADITEPEWDPEPKWLRNPEEKVSPTIQEPAITTTIKTVAMSQAPDTISQFVNGFHMSDSLF